MWPGLTCDLTDSLSDNRQGRGEGRTRRPTGDSCTCPSALDASLNQGEAVEVVRRREVLSVF